MIELITALEKISERIYEEYQKLYDLENKGLNKLSILDQERIIETLKKLKSIEDDIIEKLKERKELKKATAYLKNKYDKDSDSIYIDITQDKSGLLTHRVYNRIIYELVKEESKSDYRVLNSDIVEEFIISDYLLLSMTILEKTLPNCYKSEIYKIKYKLSLTIPDLEATLVNTQFKTSKHPYVTHKLLITNNISATMSINAAIHLNTPCFSNIFFILYLLIKIITPKPKKKKGFCTFFCNLFK